MHHPDDRSRNVIAAFALAVADAVHEATEATVGQGGATAAALVTIGAYPGRSLEALRAALRLSQPGTVRLVERLERERWVVREPSAGRAAALHLTAAGTGTLDRLLAARAAAVDGMLAAVDPETRAALTAGAEQVLAAATRDRAALERLCRLCERRVCRDCPVAAAEATRRAGA